MKILSSQQIRELDQFTIANEPIASIDLMERAASACVDYLFENDHLILGKTIKVFAGRGNNGGDGLVIARKLAEEGYPVYVYCVRTINKHTDDFFLNLERLQQQGKATIVDIDSSDCIPQLYENDVVIDAMLGSGLTRPIEGLMADLIEHINKNAYMTIAVDIPSGLYCDRTSLENGRYIIKANLTLSFLPVKLAFLFQENHPYYGEVECLDIGLSSQYLHDVEVKNYVISQEMVSPYLVAREKFSHKRHYGHALIVAGSYGMFGAAVLATGAALRSGAGLVTTHAAKTGVEILQIRHPEAIVSVDEHDYCFSHIRHLEQYSAIGIGPGLGRAPETANALKMLIQNYHKPIVFDADAINILSENPTWLSFIPKGCIFTPHLKEFERLVGTSSDDFERNAKQRDFSARYNAYVVLKGAHTAITAPDGSCYFNITGTPGMATAGSGDVLTGLITGLLAQGHHPKTAAVTGVYLHGVAGCLAAKKFGEAAMIAGDIVQHIGEAFLSVRFPRL
ncbi:MAG: NAD(P)H-hydrate dehydratase [Bacteroidales bacterium]|nr:NAD(P)H-hydrate dehydratase [Bacteroidales bacterium]